MNQTKGSYLEGVKDAEQVVQDSVNLGVDPTSTLQGYLINIDESCGADYMTGFCDYVHHFCDNKEVLIRYLKGDK